MCYRCECCNEVVPPGVTMKRLITYRGVGVRTRMVPSLTPYGTRCLKPVEEPARLEIAHEAPICAGCERFLAEVAAGEFR